MRMQPLDRHIEIKKQGSFSIIADEALNPEERRKPYSGNNGTHMVQTVCGIENHVSGRQFDLMNTEGIFHDQFTALVFVRFTQEQRCRKVRPNTVGSSCNLPDCVVHMGAKKLSGL